MNSYSSRFSWKQLAMHCLVAGTLCSLANLPTRPAYGAADAAPETDALAEIVVTAEKRDSTVEKVPISITAVSGAELLASGVADLESVAQEVPGISMKTGGPSQTEFEMRGLNSGGGNSPTVGFYVDEIPVTSFAFATAGKVVIDPDLYDLSRVEILRGPQGTLYGSGSMGGTIRLITNQPEFNEYKFSANVTGSGTQGGGANGGINAMFNLPLINDLLALRVVVTEKYTSGWIDRVVLNPFPLPNNDGCAPTGMYGCNRGNVLAAPVQQTITDTNWDHLQGVRASLLARPTDRFSAELMMMGQKTDLGGQTLIDVPPGTEAHYQPFNTPEPIEDQFWLAALTLKYQFTGADLVSASSYWHRSLSQVQDGSEVMQEVLELPGYGPAEGGLGNDPWSERDTASQWSQEIRLASSGSGPFQWLGGAFYDKLESKTDQSSYDDAAGPLFGVTTLYHEIVPQTFQQTALFGELSYKITDQLKATAGVRWFDFENSFSATELGFFGPNGDLTPGGSTSEAHDHGFNPKFNLAYYPTDDVTLYATAAKGFRPGGGNQTVPTSPTTQEGAACAASLAALGKTATPTTYAPDTVWSYELGEKMRLLDGRVSINGAIYYENWADIQREITLTCGYIYTDNAGAAAVKGAELEVSGKLSSDWTAKVNAGYTDAYYTKDSVEAGVTEGDRLPDVSKFTSSQSLLFRHELSDQYALIGRLQNDYISSRIDVTYYVDTLPAYDILSGRFGVETATWSGVFFINNATNRLAYLTAINSIVLNIPTYTRDVTNQPRTFGVDLNVRF